MTDALCSQFEKYGGIRVDKDAPRHNGDLFGARFGSLEEAVRAIATVGYSMGFDCAMAECEGDTDLASGLNALGTQLQHSGVFCVGLVTIVG